MTTNALPACERHSGRRSASPVEATVGLRGGTAAPLPVDANIYFAHCVGNVSFALTLLDELESNGRHQDVESHLLAWKEENAYARSRI